MAPAVGESTTAAGVDPGRAQVVRPGSATGSKLLHLAADPDRVADPWLAQARAAEHVDRVGAQRVVVAGVLHPEAVALDGRDDAGDVVDPGIGNG